MYTIVVIDDEKTIVEGMKVIIKSLFPDCKITGVAYNGQIGFEVVQTLKPDIVITDIRIPKLTGLEMIQKLKKSGCKSKFIILSGHTEFEYAKKGMELGVKHYIIKPVEEGELREAVSGAIQEIKEGKLQQEEINRIKNSIIDERENYKEYVLRYVAVEKSEYDDYMDYLLNTIQFPLNKKQYLCAIIQVSKSDEIDTVINRLRNDMAYYRMDFDLMFFRFTNSQIGAILFSEKELNLNRVKDIFRIEKQRLQNECGVKISASLGSIYTSANKISQSFEEARYSLNFEPVKTDNDIITFSHINDLGISERVFTEDYIYRLEKSIDIMDYEQCGTIIDELFLQINRDIKIATLQHYCLSILLFAIRKISPMQIALNDIVGKNLLSIEAISRFKTLQELKNWLKNTVRSIIDIKNLYDVPKNNELIIEKVKAYIQDHLSENINLSKIAEIVYVNPFYLSQLFQDKTGETYIHYLINLRINKAKELLKRTDLKIYEISELVGYSDSSYFSRMFEKFEGCKPTEYRKKNQ